MFGPGKFNWSKMLGVLLIGFTFLGIGKKLKAGVDLPFYAAVSAKPNVLILLDTSGSMEWYPDQARTAPVGQRRIDVAKRVLTGTGRTPITYEDNHVYMGQGNGSRSLYDDLFNAGVFLEILLLYEYETYKYRIITVDEYQQNKNDPDFTSRLYFTIKDSIDVMFGTDLTEEVYPLSKLMIEQNKFVAREAHSGLDIDGDGAYPGQRHIRKVFKLIDQDPDALYDPDGNGCDDSGGKCSYKGMLLEDYGAQQDVYIIRVYKDSQCYWSWWTWSWRPCYRPAPFPSSGNPDDDEYSDVTTFIIPDSQDTERVLSQLDPNTMSCLPDALFCKSVRTLPSFINYLQNNNDNITPDYSSYILKENMRICGDGFGADGDEENCRWDGRQDLRPIQEVVPDDTPGATKVKSGGKWTEEEIITNIMNAIPYVTEVDAWGPEQEADGIVGPEFTEEVGSTRKDIAIRQGLDWWNSESKYQPYDKTLCIDNPYFCDFFGYEEDGEHIFTGLPYDVLATEQPGIMDIYDARYGFMIFDSNNNNSDFPGRGGNLIWNLSEGSTENAWLQEVIAQNDENFDGAIGDPSNPMVINLLNNPNGCTPIAGMLRDAFTYLYAHYFDPDGLDRPDFNTYDPNHDPYPSMYGHWDPDEWDMEDFNGHILLNDPYYYYQCRKNNIIFVTDGGQTCGEPCLDSWDCYETVDQPDELEEVSAVQTKYVSYFVDPSSVIGTYQQGDWLPTKVYLVGFGLTTASGADTYAMDQLERMADASDLPDDPTDMTDPLYANSETDLITALNWIMTKILEGSYTRSLPTMNTNLTQAAAGYFDVVAEDYLWQGHLIATAPISFEGATTEISVEPKYDAGEILNQRDPDTRQIFTSIFDTLNLSWEKVDFISSEASTLYDYLFAEAQIDQDGDDDLDDTDAQILIDFIRGSEGVTYLDYYETPKQWRLGAIYHSVPNSFGSIDPNWYPDDSFKAFAEEFGNNPEILYVGALDGMLHAFFFEDPDGDGSRTPLEEAFAYVPNYLLPKLYHLRLGEQESYVDGDPKIAVMRTSWESPFPSDRWCDEDEGWCWRTKLFCGLRDGGPAYFSLDITEVSRELGHAGDDVSVGWEFTDGDTVTDQYDSILGNSWSSPVITEILYQPEGEPLDTRVALIFGGGKDPAGANGTPNKGSWLYILDADQGIPLQIIPVPSVEQKCEIESGETTLITRQLYAEKCDKKDKNMNQVPGDVKLLDVNRDGLPDWGYFGDFEGRIWKLNIHNSDPEKWGICLFFDTGDKGAYNITSSGIVEPQCDGDLSLYGGKKGPPCVDANKRRPILYSPDITRAPVGEGFVIYFGTGHVEETQEAFAPKKNYIYALIDDDNIDECTYAKIWAGEQGSESGWPIELSEGEKLISPPMVTLEPQYPNYQGEVTFITYDPSVVTNPCAPGVTYEWRVDFNTGRGAFVSQTGSLLRKIQQEGYKAINYVGNVQISFNLGSGSGGEGGKGGFDVSLQPSQGLGRFFYWWIE